MCGGRDEVLWTQSLTGQAVTVEWGAYGVHTHSSRERVSVRTHGDQTVHHTLTGRYMHDSTVLDPVFESSIDECCVCSLVGSRSLPWIRDSVWVEKSHLTDSVLLGICDRQRQGEGRS